MQQRFVEAGLVLLRHDQYVTLIVEYLLSLGLTDPVASSVPVHAAFGILWTTRLIWVLDAAGKGDQDFHIIVVVCLQIGLDLVVVADRRQPRSSDDHHFSFPTDLVFRHIPEGLHDDGRFLLEVMGMQFLKAPDGLDGLDSRDLRIVRGVLGNLETGLIGSIVLQYI